MSSEGNSIAEQSQPLPVGPERGGVAPIARPGARFATFGSLRIANYRWYWLGMIAMFAAIQMELLVRGWLIYDMTESSLLLGLVMAVWGVPIILFSLVGGAIADRVDKRQLLIVTQVGTGLTTLALALLLYLEAIQWWHFMVVALLQGILFAGNAPARMSIIPELVGDRELLNAIALGSAGMNLMRVFAPALGGVLLAAIAADGVYFLVVALHGASVACLSMMKTAERTAPAPSRPWRADLGQGLSFVRGSPVIASLLAMALVPMLFAMPYLFLMPVFAADVLKVGEAGLGWLMSMVGVGGLIGALSIASLRGFRRKGLLLLTMVLAFGITLGAFSVSRTFVLSLILLVAVGATSIGYVSVNNTLIQTNTPHYLRGRVLSFFTMTFGLFPLGTLPMGALAEAVGAPLAVGIGGLLLILLTLGMAVFRPELRHLE